MLTTSQIQGGEAGGLCNSPSQYPRVSNSKEGCRSVLKTRLSALFQPMGCESRADSCTETTWLMQCSFISWQSCRSNAGHDAFGEQFSDNLQQLPASCPACSVSAANRNRNCWRFDRMSDVLYSSTTDLHVGCLAHVERRHDFPALNLGVARIESPYQAVSQKPHIEAIWSSEKITKVRTQWNT